MPAVTWVAALEVLTGAWWLKLVTYYNSVNVPTMYYVAQNSNYRTTEVLPAAYFICVNDSR